MKTIVIKNRLIAAFLTVVLCVSFVIPGSAEISTLEKTIETGIDVLSEDSTSQENESAVNEISISDDIYKHEFIPLSGDANTISYVVGELMSHDIDSNGCINIDGTDYEVSDIFEAKVGNLNIVDFVLHNDDKTVVAKLVNNKVTKLQAIADVIKPKIEIVLNPSSVSYENGKFDNDKISVSVSFGVGLKSDYNSIIVDAINEKGMSWSFSGYELELGKGLNFKKLLMKYQTEKSNEDITVEFGKKKNFEFEAYLNNNAVVEPAQKIKAILKTKFNEDEEMVFEELSVTNVSLQTQVKQNNAAELEAQQALANAELALEKTTFALSSYPMEQAGYTKSQQNQINQIVRTWVRQILVTEVLSRDTGSSQAFWDQYCESAGFGSSERKNFITKVVKSAFKKLGVDVSPLIDDSKWDLDWEDTEASTEIRLYDSTRKKYDTIKVYLTIQSYNVTGDKPFAGQGTLTYTIKTYDKKTYDQLNVGSVSFADLQAFSESMTSLCMAEVKKIYNMDIGRYINKGYDFSRNKINSTTSSKIAEILTSDSIDKILQKKYGSCSDNVFRIYTDSIKKTTKVSNHCPVDLYIYDSNGNLCGYVIDNEASVLDDNITLYCEGDAKYYELSGDNYYVTAIGSDEGTMKYEVSEYIDSELVRTITYDNIPLENGLSYESMIPEFALPNNVTAK